MVTFFSHALSIGVLLAFCLEFSSHQIVKSRKRVADSPPGKLAKTRKIGSFIDQ